MKNSIQRLQLQFSISMQTLLLGLLPSCKLLCYELDQLSEITCGAESPGFHPSWFAEQQYTPPPLTYTLFLCGTCNSLRNLLARDLYWHWLCRNSFAAASLYRTSFTTPYMCWTFNPNLLYCGIFYRNLSFVELL
jgi:hypothetical protein